MCVHEIQIAFIRAHTAPSKGSRVSCKHEPSRLLALTLLTTSYFTAPVSRDAVRNSGTDYACLKLYKIPLEVEIQLFRAQTSNNLISGALRGYS